MSGKGVRKFTPGRDPLAVVLLGPPPSNRGISEDRFAIADNPQEFYGDASIYRSLQSEAG